MPKEVAQERPAETRIKEGRKWNKKRRVTEKEKRRIGEMQEGKQLRDPLLLGSWKKKVRKKTQNDKLHRITSGKSFPTPQVNQQLKLLSFVGIS